MSNLQITPKTKIYELLDAYPQLEEVLIELVPSFSKLKNPILRRTIARVTTLQQAAKVGEIEIEKIIKKFREIIGDENITGDFSDEKRETIVPLWFDSDRIVKTFDATETINKGGHPLDTVLREAKMLEHREIYELITPFYPAPLVEMMENKGYLAYSLKADNEQFKSYFTKKD